MLNLNNQPIGLLDSGLGGLTVLKQVQAILPNENTIFIADQKNLPYGEKTPEEILTFSRQLVQFLLQQNVKAIIFACNTATAWAMETIRAEVDVPLIGVIQSGSLAASQVTKNQQVGVIATKSTISAHAYQKEMAMRAPEVELVELATPDFVPYIESGQFQTPQPDLIAKSLASLKDSTIDTLILGCTHYPIIESQIRDYLGSKLKIIDPAIQSANYTRNVLKQQNLLNEGHQKPQHQFYTTGNAANFTKMAQDILPEMKITTQKVNLTEDEK